MKAQNNTNRKNGKKPFNNPQKIKIRCIKNKVPGVIIAGQFAGKAAAHTAAVNNQ